MLNADLPYFEKALEQNLISGSAGTIITADVSAFKGHPYTGTVTKTTAIV
jgi:hypothetical protein